MVDDIGVTVCNMMKLAILTIVNLSFHLYLVVWSNIVPFLKFPTVSSSKNCVCYKLMILELPSATRWKLPNWYLVNCLVCFVDTQLPKMIWFHRGSQLNCSKIFELLSYILFYRPFIHFYYCVGVNNITIYVPRFLHFIIGGSLFVLSKQLFRVKKAL